MAAEELIEKLELIPYPGDVCKSVYYKEVYRSHLKVKPLSDDRAERNAISIIYVLAKKSSFGMWRRLKSDETYFYHKGNPMKIAVIKPDKSCEVIVVGDVLKFDEAQYSYTIVANSWFNACPGQGEDDYALCSAAVAPGFDLEDVVTADRAKMVAEFPQHKMLIEEFTSQ